MVATALALGLALSGCGSEAESKPAAGGDGSPASMVPSDIRDKGVLTIAGDASYPPIGFMGEDGTTIEGLDAELAAELGKVLDLKVKDVNTSFDSIIPGLQGRKYDMGMSWMNDTEERQKVVDFVDYSRDGSSILAKADASAAPTTLDELCGLSVAVQKGTVQQNDATAQSSKCEDAGKDKVDVQTYPDQSAANLALISGRADVTIADTPVAVWQEKQTKGKLKISGEPYGAVYHGIALVKGSGMVDAVAAAMQELMDNGTYGKILAKWGMDNAVIDKVLVNGKARS
jgi:polar amino acid transport system substrate-binding protein